MSIKDTIVINHKLKIVIDCNIWNVYLPNEYRYGHKLERLQLERLQERALRAIYNCRTDTYEDILCRANLPSLYNRRLQEILILMYKVRNSLAPDYVGVLFNFANKGYSLRNTDFDIPRYFNSKILKTFY